MKTILLALALLALAGCEKPISTDPAENLNQIVADAAASADGMELAGAVDRENGTIFLTKKECPREQGYYIALYVSNGKNADIGPPGMTSTGCWTAVGKMRILVDWDRYDLAPMMYAVDKLYDPDTPKVEAEVKK